MKKHWYLTLSVVWITFWTLDIFFLIPESPMVAVRLFGTDDLAFSVYWLWITAPISLYLLVAGATRLTQWMSHLLKKAQA